MIPVGYIEEDAEERVPRDEAYEDGNDPKLPNAVEYAPNSTMVKV